MVTALIAYNYLKGNPFISYGENVFIGKYYCTDLKVLLIWNVPTSHSEPYIGVLAMDLYESKYTLK